MQTLFSVPKIGLFVETYHPVKEKRRDDEVVCIRIKFRVQPFDAKLATSIDDGLDAGVRALLFKLHTVDPKPTIGGLKLNLDCPRQNIELFATPDTDDSRLVLLQTKISGANAQEKDAVFVFYFEGTHGPVDRDTLEYVHSLVGKQIFATFTESEPSIEFSATEPEDDEDEAGDPPMAPIFEDDDEDPESEAVNAAKENTENRRREKAHRYPKKKKAAKTGKKGRR